MGIPAGRPSSVNEIVLKLIRTFVDDVGCDVDDAAPLRISPGCIFDKDMPRATRTRISVGAMPCVIIYNDELPFRVTE